MKSAKSARQLGIMVLALVVGTAAIGWYCGTLATSLHRPPSNSIMIIAPYRYNGTWVFDDPATGLVREPFVGGVPEMIDALVAGIPNADKGFRLMFSVSPFTGYQKKLTWTRGDATGNWYRSEDPPMEGWLCPALLRYYEKPPREFYVRADPKKP